MQWEHCQGCEWSVPLGTVYCEVCMALLEGMAACSVEAARVYLRQRWRRLGSEEMEQRYSAARTVRRRFADRDPWEEFFKRNLASPHEDVAAEPC